MSKTLLLVEDSFTIQKVVESTFTSAGFQVVVANDVRAGLDALSHASPDVILADASLPQMDGFQLCRTIRETPGYEQVPIILLTSRFTTYDEAHGRRVGVSGYLAKPFDSYTLLSLVQELVNSAPPPLFAPEPSTALPHEALPNSTRAPAEAHREPPETPPTAARPSASMVASADISLVYQALSANLLHIVQETVQSYLATLLDALTPHIVDEVRATVNAKMPDLLEALLQQEIEKLKRATAQNDDESLGSQPSAARRDEHA